MDRLKFKLEIVEALSASSPTNKSILTDDEDNIISCNSTRKKIEALSSTCYTCHGFYPGHSRVRGLTCIAVFDMFMTFEGLASADLKTAKAVRKHVVKNAMVIYTCQKQNKKNDFCIK
ncbi:uncharacterized protein TNCV_3013701 [Trichonephila clavipes]|nr:uncharacterized protein TNCV_3013701 [Trichonephila clavipes]